jgi:hypothetical protein
MDQIFYLYLMNYIKKNFEYVASTIFIFQGGGFFVIALNNNYSPIVNVVSGKRRESEPSGILCRVTGVFLLF